MNNSTLKAFIKNPVIRLSFPEQHSEPGRNFPESPLEYAIFSRDPDLKNQTAASVKIRFSCIFTLLRVFLSKISRFVKIRISDFSQKYFGRHDLIRRDHAPHIPRSPLFCTNSFWPVSEHTISIADIRSPDCNEIPMFRLSRLGDLAAGSLYSYFPLTFLSTSVLPNRRICIITRLTFILKFEHLPDSRTGYRLYVFQSAPQRFLGQIRHIAGISGLSEDRHCCRGFIFSR